MPTLTTISVLEAGITITASLEAMDDPGEVVGELKAICQQIADGTPTATQNRPAPTTANTGRPSGARPASPAQRRFISSLCDNNPQRLSRVLAAHGVNTLSDLPAKAAHQIIDSLKGSGA